MCQPGWGLGGNRGEGINVYVYTAESLHCSPETITALFIGYTPVQNGEGNGTPPQCSCLENPRDRGAWWAAVYAVAQSWTQLKRLSSSSRWDWMP